MKANYALLLVMRCLQSAGSSGTIALSLATVSDIVTSAERGRYTSNVQMGWMLGPSFGPVRVPIMGSSNDSRSGAYENLFWMIRSLEAYLVNILAGGLSSGFSPSLLQLCGSFLRFFYQRQVETSSAMVLSYLQGGT